MFLTSFWCFIVNFEHISHFFSVSFVDFEKVKIKLGVTVVKVTLLQPSRQLLVRS